MIYRWHILLAGQNTPVGVCVCTARERDAKNKASGSAFRDQRILQGDKAAKSTPSLPPPSQPNQIHLKTLTQVCVCVCDEAAEN